ncbi:MAG: hypothetical protein ACP5NX_03770, partial [Candidatus Bilamarchaeaceae archaeon]
VTVAVPSLFMVLRDGTKYEQIDAMDALRTAASKRKTRMGTVSYMADIVLKHSSDADGRSFYKDLVDLAVSICSHEQMRPDIVRFMKAGLRSGDPEKAAITADGVGRLIGDKDCCGEFKDDLIGMIRVGEGNTWSTAALALIKMAEVHGHDISDALDACLTPGRDTDDRVWMMLMMHCATDCGKKERVYKLLADRMDEALFGRTHANSITMLMEMGAKGGREAERVVELIAYFIKRSKMLMVNAEQNNKPFIDAIKTLADISAQAKKALGLCAESP